MAGLYSSCGEGNNETKKVTFCTKICNAARSWVLVEAAGNSGALDLEENMLSLSASSGQAGRSTTSSPTSWKTHASDPPIEQRGAALDPAVLRQYPGWGQNHPPRVRLAALDVQDVARLRQC